MDDESKFTPKEVWSEFAIADFLDGRGKESEHQTAQELEALFGIMQDLPELEPILAITDDEFDQRHLLVTFLQREGMQHGNGFEREVEMWVQAFVTNWHEPSEE